MRAASLVPSGTLLLRALGVEPVGVSHSCPNPTGLPVLTESLIPQGLSQEEIDRKVREAYARGLSLYRVRTERLQALAPDLLRLGKALGREVEAEGLARRLEAALRDLPPPLEPPPGVVFLEWLDPPYLGGHWVAEAVALAGGRYLGPGPGAPSRRARPEELPEAQVVFLAFCGFGLPEALRAVEVHLARGGWLGGYLRGKRAFLLDAGPFHALTPLTVEGVARLARLLRGEAAEGAYALAL